MKYLVWQVTGSMAGVVKSMESAMRSMNLEKVSLVSSLKLIQQNVFNKYILPSNRSDVLITNEYIYFDHREDNLIYD